MAAKWRRCVVKRARGRETKPIARRDHEDGNRADRQQRRQHDGVLLLFGFSAGALALARTSSVAAAWVGVGFGLRALHAAMEAAAYAVNLTSTGQGDSAFAVPANALLAAHYALGIGAGWLLAMGCVIGNTNCSLPTRSFSRRRRAFVGSSTAIR